MKENEALDLLEDHLDGQLDLDAQQEKELAQWLRENPENADRAFQRIMLHVLLTRKGDQAARSLPGTSLVSRDLIESNTRRSQSPRRWKWQGVLLLSTIVVATIVGYVFLNSNLFRDQQDVPTGEDEPIAFTGPRNSASLLWSSEVPPADLSQWPADSHWKLTSGMAELYDPAGTNLILLGPAEIDYQSTEKLTLQRGGIAVASESTSPVHIETADGTIVPQSRTKCGIYVGSDTGTIVDVLSGSVTLRPQPDRLNLSEATLLAGQSVWIDRGRVIVMEPGWIERHMGPIRAALQLRPDRPLDVPWVHEAFDYPESVFNSQLEHAGVAFHHGGWGWRSAWSERGNLVSSIERAPLRWNKKDDRRALGELTYHDTDGNQLKIHGGQLRTCYGASNLTVRALALDQLPAGVVDDQGLGKDGSEVWVSFLAQSFDSQAEHRYSFLQLGDSENGGLCLGKFEENSNWGVEYEAPEGEGSQVLVSNVPTGESVFYVARIRFLSGSDEVAVWLNTSLSGPPDEGDANFKFHVRDFRIRDVSIHSRYSTDFDEIRIGPTFHSVAPCQSN